MVCMNWAFRSRITSSQVESSNGPWNGGAIDGCNGNESCDTADIGDSKTDDELTSPPDSAIVFGLETRGISNSWVAVCAALESLTL